MKSKNKLIMKFLKKNNNFITTFHICNDYEFRRVWKKTLYVGTS